MEKKEMQGIFFESLKRNNKQIRDDRAQAIAEDTEMAYKRQVEDLAIKIKRLSRQREGMLDLSPTDAMSLKLANDFDAQEFVEKASPLNSFPFSSMVTINLKSSLNLSW